MRLPNGLKLYTGIGNVCLHLHFNQISDKISYRILVISSLILFAASIRATTKTITCKDRPKIKETDS